jgi:hypothetical protein
LTTLEAVVHGHTHSIPFENLSLTHPLAVPTNGEPAISTDQTAIFDKLVVKQRGGYCFEVRTVPRLTQPGCARMAVQQANFSQQTKVSCKLAAARKISRRLHSFAWSRCS